jgi:ppGpp synthetase/RelA/SpoT-type nucleotidyltranferase
VTPVNRAAQIFLRSFEERRYSFERAAVEMQSIIEEMVSAVGVPIHAVRSRAKDPASLRSKLRRKRYSNPAVQVTDLVAVRVITYFGRDIDRVERHLRAALDISDRKSRDAREELADDQFGYRSVHLVARLRPRSVRIRSDLGRRWFEVQIRSILDHAWSEIEHEAVYKSGIDFPSSTRRKFKAIAASLEVLEDALAALDAERDNMIARHRIEYEADAGADRPFDVARLLAFLEVTYPSGEGWRQAEVAGHPFPHRSAAAAVDLLREARLDRPSRLQSVLESRAFRDAAFRFAATEGLAVDSVSHLGLVVLAVGATDPSLVKERFPEMLFSPAIAEALGPL